MKTNSTFVHPELVDFMNICAVSPEGSKKVCELIQSMIDETEPKNKERAARKQRKKDKQLDRDLEDTFPASDPFTHY